ncbi:GlxA family transcriptional regulator [Pseudovibrio brasiliensis]|uniref:Helix-turn-helix domain-containing protein n=1 Tax=Pseudovibrio brasiliensis TaxID=1898042 RepID=A0ABX8AML0_9HYPH|nr:helix-turn-helix domain-containing protein [Pseudovibrio brasiliensis]QUS55502.1 helix-turn-helix domain-containing protein [Pseudovibrio brasiliensis]
MSKSDKHHRIGILSYTGAQLSAIYGLVDMLNAANKDEATRMEAVILQQDHLPKIENSTFSAVILPPSLAAQPPTVSATLTRWLKQQHEHGAILCSICVGAALLAETGILDGRPATTHWAITESFAERFPLVKLDTDKMIIDEGDVITAGGIMAWTDLGLRLIDHFAGHATMLEVARHFLIDPAGREQKYYRRFYPNLSHGDQAILKAQHWLQVAYKQKLTVPNMAEKAGLTGRTFLRRFEAATGHTPNAYLQQLRITEARQQLEQTKRSFNEIAWEVGYDDPTACRRVFIKTTGLSPGQYRQKFGYQSHTV